MKRILPVLTAAVLLSTFTVQGIAADAKAELNDLVSKVQADIRSGKHTEADLSGDIKKFDDLLAEHKGEKTDDVAQILFMKADLYAEVFDDLPKAKEIFQQVKTDFPGTKQAGQVDSVLASMEKQEAAKKIQSTLVKGAVFPDFNVQDIDGKPLSVSQYKGKTVLIDFWATWCGPCMRELPNVQKVYQKYHDKGFEIIGISLDSNKDTLAGFLKQEKIPWQQYCDTKGWQSPLAEKYGIVSIPSTFLLDKDGKIFAKNVRGDDLDKAVTTALFLAGK